MTEEEKKQFNQMKEQVATLTTQLTSAQAELKTATGKVAELTATNGKLAKDIESKDKLIDTQKTQIIGQRRKLADYTKEELDEMTDAEKEALRGADDTQARLDKIEKETQDRLARERDDRVATTISKYANKPDVQEAIRKNLERLADFPKAITASEIEAAVKVAVNMLGPGAEVNGLRQNINGGNSGDAPGDSNSQERKSFADTSAGQALLGKIMPSAVGPLTEAQKAAEAAMGAKAPAQK